MMAPPNQRCVPGDGRDVADWIGHQRVIDQVPNGFAVDCLAAVLDMERSPGTAGTVPSGWHVITFLPCERASRIAVDGHVVRGDFIPPIRLPRRVFGGSSARFHRPLQTGIPARLTETITGIEEKQGASGPLVLLRIERRYVQHDTVCVVDDQTIIYRSAVGPERDQAVPHGRRQQPPPAAQWREHRMPSSVDLFRFSAVTMNAHRIHYDREYATKQEGYPGLVIHGPFTALSLLEEARQRKPDAALRQFEYRTKAPLFDLGGFAACGRFVGDRAELWAEAPDGTVAMTARAVFDGHRPGENHRLGQG